MAARYSSSSVLSPMIGSGDGVGAGSQHHPQQVAAHQEAAQPVVGFEAFEQRAGAGDLLELVGGGAHQHDGAEEAHEHRRRLEAHEHGGEPAVDEDEHGGQAGEAGAQDHRGPPQEREHPQDAQPRDHRPRVVNGRARPCHPDELRQPQQYQQGFRARELFQEEHCFAKRDTRVLVWYEYWHGHCRPENHD